MESEIYPTAEMINVSGSDFDKTSSKVPSSLVNAPDFD